MAKYDCPFCDRFVHTSGGIPNPNEFLVWSATQWDALPEGQLTSDALYQEATPMYKCVGCTALAIFWQGYATAPVWYQRKEVPNHPLQPTVFGGG